MTGKKDSPRVDRIVTGLCQRCGKMHKIEIAGEDRFSFPYVVCDDGVSYLFTGSSMDRPIKLDSLTKAVPVVELFSCCIDSCVDAKKAIGVLYPVGTSVENFQALPKMDGECGVEIGGLTSNKIFVRRITMLYRHALGERVPGQVLVSLWSHRPRDSDDILGSLNFWGNVNLLPFASYPRLTTYASVHDFSGVPYEDMEGTYTFHATFRDLTRKYDFVKNTQLSVFYEPCG